MEISNNVFFVIGCARSGTTAISVVLSKAINAEVFTEQIPNLCIESRKMYDGRIHNPEFIIRNAKEKYILETLSHGKMYGDKNPNYLPFVPVLQKLWHPKFLFVIRDGREVVRSLMDWHELSRGGIYAMKEDEVTSEIDSPEADWWDYSRIRPRIGEPYFDEWRQLSRFEKCSWMWSRFNNLILQQLNSLDKSHYRVVNMNKFDRDEIENTIDFLGLKFENLQTVQDMLNSGINSAKHKFGVDNKFPSWEKWSSKQHKQFDSLAGETMKQLGYY